jgi:hypothetical protein
MTMQGNSPSMEWLRLSPRQTRVFLAAWSADSIICKGRDLNAAHRLSKLWLLRFLGPIDGGLRGEFQITDIARDYPPIGLKALLVHHSGRRALEEEK